MSYLRASTPYENGRSLRPGKTWATKIAHVFMEVGLLEGIKINLVKHRFALYGLPLSLSLKKFLASYARSIAFYPQLEIRARNVP